MTDPVTRLNAALSGRYKIERQLGEGGMATVYLADDLKHERKVALKVLKPELAAVVGAERFLAEIKTTANLQHPHILPLFDSGQADSFLFYVMPYVEGDTLRDRLDRDHQLPVDEAVQIATNVAEALDYAHSHGVIHRDIKPANILLQAGKPVISDFGIALAVGAAGGSRLTETGLSVGTPFYMSPEQATGDRTVDGRTDIYSLGAVTYEMLTGEPPHAGPTAQAVIAKLMTEDVRPVTALRRTVPMHVSYAVHRSLERLAADRFGTARDLGDALAGRIPMETLAAHAGPATEAGIGARRSRASRLLSSPMFTIGALALAAVAAFGWWRARGSAPQPTVRFLVTLPPGMQVGSRIIGSGSSLALSPDGRTLAFVAVGGGPPQQLYIRTIDDLRARALPGTEGASAPFFSQDGKEIAFFSGQVLKKTSVAGGGARVLTERLHGQLFGGTWSRSGDIVLGIEGRLVVLPASGGVPRALYPSDTTSGRVLRWPRILADGRTLLFSNSTGPNQTSRIAVGSLDGKAETMLELPGVYPLGEADGQLVYVRGSGDTGALMAVAFDVKRHRLTGGPRRVGEDVSIAPTGMAQADLSESGTLVRQSGTTASQLVLVDSSGGTEPLIDEARNFTFVRYSPDGRRIALAIESGSSADVWIYDLASRTLTRLTAEDGLSDRPEWTPDGRRVIFRSDRGGSGFGVWAQPSDNSGPAVPLLQLAGQDVWEGFLARNGRTLLYRTGTVGTADVWRRSTAGDTVPVGVTTLGATEWAPRLSPDEKWIAYGSDASGEFQVYVQPFPGPGAVTQISDDGGDSPIWSPDGRRLFYVNQQQVHVATLVTTPSLAVIARDRLFPGTFNYLVGHANYDVSPDGKRLLLIKSVSETETIVVLNWGTELRAAAPGTPP